MIEVRLKAMGLNLPQVAAPKGSYVPFLVSRGHCFVSGQLPPTGSPDSPSPYCGTVGVDVSIETAQVAARQCALMILAQLGAALEGDFERVARIVRLGGFVRAVPEFTAHPQVVNGASNLMIELFGDAGRHTRAAVGVSSLPLGVCVEIDAIVELKT
ncbi:RidA family protein [Pelagibacterium montanilacus]|uniref:RidA family protein n=1 Tax=Pelagibacterium montanilacus TaxID=2185280 RepID=UPI001FE97E02|nr:RidA family protein [Pelagibacterium montanilacus]